jgi:hypothetical protein
MLHKNQDYVHFDQCVSYFVITPSTIKLSGALTISYEIICDICINSIHKYIYIYLFGSGRNVTIMCVMSCYVNVLYCLYRRLK